MIKFQFIENHPPANVINTSLELQLQPYILSADQISYGTKTLKLSNGEKIEIPNVVRTVIASRIVDLYQQYCQETGFLSIGRSTLFSILQARIKTIMIQNQKKSEKRKKTFGFFYSVISRRYHKDIIIFIESCFSV